MDAAPAPAPRPRLAGLLTPVAIFTLVGFMAYDRMNPPQPAGPDRAVNAVALGKTYAPTLAATYASGWDDAAKAVEDGKTIADAQKALQDTWKAARVAAFTKDVQPGFALVLPEGTEPSDAAKRQQIAQLWRDFAKGLRGGK
jgi:hypothetical protein